MRECGEAEAGGVRVLLQPVAPSQSVSQSVRRFHGGAVGKTGAVSPWMPPPNTVLHPLTEGALGQFLWLSFSFGTIIRHFHSGDLDDPNTHIHTHSQHKHSLCFVLRPKTLVPPSYTAHTFKHSLNAAHTHKCNPPPPVHLQGGSVDCWSRQRGFKPKQAESNGWLKTAPKTALKETMNQECFPVFIYFIILYVYMYAWWHDMTKWHTSMHKHVHKGVHAAGHTCHIKKDMQHIWW